MMPCLHRIVAEINLGQHGHLRKSQPCPHPAQSNGWCRDHQEGREIMAIGASCGYPGVWANVYWEIGEGYASWLAFASVARPSRATQIRLAVQIIDAAEKVIVAS